MKTDVIPLLNPAPGIRKYLNVFRLGPDDATRKIYIQAGLHADEWPGLLVIQHLTARLNQLEVAQALRAQFIIVPFANPIGMAQNYFGATLGRFFSDNGQNFNRQMAPDFNHVMENLTGKLSEHDPAFNQKLIKQVLMDAHRLMPETNELQFLHKTLLGMSLKADMVLDLHCDQTAITHVYCAEHQQDFGKKLSLSLGARVLIHEDVRRDVAFDGSQTKCWRMLQDQYPDFPISQGCYSATIELRGKADVSDQLAAKDAENLIRFFGREQLIMLPDNFPDEAPPAPLSVASTEQILIIHSPGTGILLYLTNNGDEIKKGSIVAEIVLIDSDEPNTRIQISSQYDGVLFVSRQPGLVRPGEVVAMLATAETVRAAGNQLHQ